MSRTLVATGYFELDTEGKMYFFIRDNDGNNTKVNVSPGDTLELHDKNRSIITLHSESTSKIFRRNDGIGGNDG